MADAELWVCPECSTVKATFKRGKQPEECEACDFNIYDSTADFRLAGGVSR